MLHYSVCEAMLFGALIQVLLATAGAVREDTYRTLCPDHAASVYMFRQQNVLVRSQIQCVALCQQDQRCSSVTFHDNQCSLITSDESSCEERAVGQGSLERVSSSWCSHGGMPITQDFCECLAPYDGTFCTVGNESLCLYDRM